MEDSPSDALLTKEAFGECNVRANIYVVRDGVEGIKFLRKEEGYSNAVKPDLILLDLNMPRMNGKEVLSKIKQDEDMKLIPVIVLTTSQANQDVIDCHELHANSYVLKPINYVDFLNVVKNIVEYWLNIVQLPNTYLY